MPQADVSKSELLSWYAEAGVDVALTDSPVNRFEEAAANAAKKQKPPPAPRNVKPSPPRGTQPQPAVPDSNAIALATQVAQSAATLVELRAGMEKFESCNLKFTARSTVFGEGNPKSKFMLVGGTPGREEDAQGVPFVGHAGQLLDRMLDAIGLNRSLIYMANCGPWRPPGGRSMSPAETEICRPFIERHIQLADPEILILAGGASTKMILKNKRDIMGLRGKWVEFSSPDRPIPTLPILSPEFLLKNPVHKNLAWQDMLTIRARINRPET